MTYPMLPASIPPRTPAQLAEDERPIFEQWVLSIGDFSLLQKDKPHRWYLSLTVTGWWTGWSERASLSEKVATDLEIAIFERWVSDGGRAHLLQKMQNTEHANRYQDKVVQSWWSGWSARATWPILPENNDNLRELVLSNHFLS